MSDCNHNCESCSSSCGDRKEKNDFTVQPNEQSNIKKVNGVVSGKGGGKPFDINGCIHESGISYSN